MLIGPCKSLSLRQRLCRGFSMLECFSHVLLCASYVLRVVLTQETAFERPLAAAKKAAVWCLPQPPTQSNTAVVHNHRESLIACQPCYLLEWSAPPSLSPSSPVCILLSCLIAVLVSSCRVPPGHCCYCRPAVQFNDTQDHRPSHPHLRPLRLCRPQLKASNPPPPIPDSAYRCCSSWLR